MPFQIARKTRTSLKKPENARVVAILVFVPAGSAVWGSLRILLRKASAQGLWPAGFRSKIILSAIFSSFWSDPTPFYWVRLCIWAEDLPRRGYRIQPRVSTLGIIHQERRALKATPDRTS